MSSLIILCMTVTFMESLTSVKYLYIITKKDLPLKISLVSINNYKW